MSKLIIRHCKNCKFNGNYVENKWDDSNIRYEVKYKRILNENQRKQALFCPYFQKKRSEQQWNG